MPPITEEEKDRARKALKAAKDSLSEAALKVVCEAEEDAWRLTLESSSRVTLSGISRFRAWPITVMEQRASDAYGLSDSRAVALGKFDTESVTGLIAFELVTEIKEISFRMVLNLPVVGLPENRDDAIFRLILKTREGFLRYVLLLLGEYTDGFGGGRDIFSLKTVPTPRPAALRVT